MRSLHILAALVVLAFTPVLLLADVGESTGRAECLADEKLPIEDFRKVAQPVPASDKQKAKYRFAVEDFVKANKALAELCAKRGLDNECNYHRGLAGEKPDKPDERFSKAKGQDYREYRKALREKYGTVANKWVDYANAAKSEGNREQYRSGMCQALSTWFDCEGARKARGEALVKGFGWLPQARAETLNKSARNGLEPPKDLDAFDKTYAQPGVGYVLVTKHFAICSTAKFAATAELVKGFDALYDAVAKSLGGYSELADERIGVYALGTAAEFNEIRSQRGVAGWAEGFYSVESGTAVFPLAGPVSSNTANHELTHAVVDYALRGRCKSGYDGTRKLQSPKSMFFWTCEGIAMYLSAFDAARPEAPLNALQAMENTFKAMGKKCRDLEHVFSRNQDSWNDGELESSRNYAAAAALTDFCLNEQKDKYAACFLRLMHHHYRFNLEIGDFDAAFGAKRADFEADYFKWFDEKVK